MISAIHLIPTIYQISRMKVDFFVQFQTMFTAIC